MERKEVICTSYSREKRHDFSLSKEPKVGIKKEIKAITDIGYQGIAKIHIKSALQKKRRKKKS